MIFLCSRLIRVSIHRLGLGGFFLKIWDALFRFGFKMRKPFICFSLLSSWLFILGVISISTVRAGEYDALCNDVDCQITITEKGFLGPKGFIAKETISQWDTAGDSYNLGLGAGGGVVGGIAGFVVGFTACYSGVYCPMALAGGTFGGVKIGSNLGNGRNFLFTVVGQNKDGAEVVESFRFINKKSAKKLKKELRELTGLEMGELRKEMPL